MSKIATGGMGAVYLAEHPVTGSRVAVKVIHHELVSNQDIVKRFIQEAQAVNRIGHEHIIEIYDFGATEDGDQFYIMEYLEGRTLAAVMGQQPQLEVSRATKIAAQIAAALAAAHAAGVIHRDLKPDNIMLTSRRGDDDFVKILDFGLAKLFAIDSTVKTQNGVLLGTPQYMSPEACEGKRAVDHRTDIYALGILLYQMATSQLPFDGTIADVLSKQIGEPPPPPRSVNPSLRAALEQIILRCLAKQPELRYQSMNELRDALLEPDEDRTARTALPSAPSALLSAAVSGVPSHRQVTEIAVGPAVGDDTETVAAGAGIDGDDGDDADDDASGEPDADLATARHKRRGAQAPSAATEASPEPPEPTLTTTVRTVPRTPPAAMSVEYPKAPPRRTPRSSRSGSGSDDEEATHSPKRTSMATVAAVVAASHKRWFPPAGAPTTARMAKRGGRRSARARWPFVVLAALALGAGALALVWLVGNNDVDGAGASEPPAELAATPSLIPPPTPVVDGGSPRNQGSAAVVVDAATIGRVELISEPAGAVVFGPDDSKLGTTPIIAPWPISTYPVTFRFELAGFQPKFQEVVVAASTSLHVVLQKGRHHHSTHPRPRRSPLGSAAAGSAADP